MFFPEYRARRLRRSESLRNMVRETFLRPEDLIYPMFSAFGKNVRKEIISMPGIYQQSIEHIVAEAKEVYQLGIPAVILFGIPEEKDPLGQDAYSESGIIQETIRAIKADVPKLLVITDVCMCEYTDHGHCGVIKDGDVDNDETLKLLAAEALSHARAGADIVAPSDMMDGRIAALRGALANADILVYGHVHEPGSRRIRRAEDFRSVIRVGPRVATRTVVLHVGPLGCSAPAADAGGTHTRPAPARAGFVVGRSVARSAPKFGDSGPFANSVSTMFICSR